MYKDDLILRLKKSVDFEKSEIAYLERRYARLVSGKGKTNQLLLECFEIRKSLLKAQEQLVKELEKR